MTSTEQKSVEDFDDYVAETDGLIQMVEGEEGAAVEEEEALVSPEAEQDEAVATPETAEAEAEEAEEVGDGDVADADAGADADAAAAANPPASVHGRNATTLAKRNPLRGDDLVSFEEADHKYTVHGGSVDRSTTRVLADYFEQFDPVENTLKYYDRWRTNPEHKYYARIHEVLDAGGSAEDARAAIRGDWTKLGEAASRLGTLFHLYAEFVENDEIDEAPTDAFSEISHEVRQYHAFKESEWATSLGLEPVRTELCVFHRVANLNVCAGQVDMLYRGSDGLYYLMDWKRTAKHHTLNASDKAYADRRGLGPMAHLPDTDFQRYSLQTSTYNRMLFTTHGIDVGERMFLVRVHADRGEYELVKCRDLRVEAQAMLDGEHRRLVRHGITSS